MNKKQQKVAVKEPKVKKAIIKKPKVPVKVVKKIATKKIVKPTIAAVKRKVVVLK